MRETAEAIDDQAMRWVARIDRGALEPHAQSDLDAWLAGDTRRRGAFLRAEAAWRMLDRASVPIDEPEGNESEPAPVSRRWLLAGAGGLAASIVLAIALLGVSDPRPGKIETARGEIRRVPLGDGSMAVVNTASRVAVALAPDTRAVTLDQGEAWFQVAKDKTRPFVVSAGDVRVRAIGTAFSVRRHSGGADVQVTEGVVEAWVVGEEADTVRIARGAKAFIDVTTGPAIPSQAALEIDRNLAWRTGQIILDGDTLGEAAAEFNRYNGRKIVIDDPQLAAEKLVGRFRTNEPEAFVRAAVATLGMRADNAADAITLSRAERE